MAVVPLLVGIALIIALIVYEYRARHPLLILRALASTIPVTGVVVAMLRGGGGDHRRSR